MQKTIPYRNWLTTTTSATGEGISAAPPPNSSEEVVNSLRKLVEDNAVVVFARRGCCMCHVVRLLLNGHGVNPFVFNVDEENESEVIDELSKIGNVAAGPPLLTVFLGGKLFGGLEELMGAHISGELLPKLREAKALWL